MHAITPESRLGRIGTEWSRFWFLPGDPTVLGAIRILTGLLTFYTLLLYCFDLQEMMGENAWLDLKLRQEQYHDAPVPAYYLSWNEYGTFPAPRNEEEKRYFDEYMVKWGNMPPGPYPKSAKEIQEIDAYRAQWGIDPRMVVTRGRPIWSVWFHVIDPFWMSVVHGGILTCAFLFLIGFGTRITSVLTWFGALCYIHRDPAVLFGVDTMMTVLLMYLMVGPSGAALSVDRWLQCRRARRLGLPEPPLTPSVSATFALRLIQIHLCIIYFSAGLAKLQGAAWWQCTAPWATMANYEYAPMQLGLYVDFLRFLAKYRWLYELTMTTGSIMTLAFEIGYPFVIWQPRLRAVWLWIALILHLGIGMCMGLRTFSLMMLAFNLAFVSPETVRRVIQRVLPASWRDQPPPSPEAPKPPPEPEKQVRPAVVRQEKPAKPVAGTSVKHKR